MANGNPVLGQRMAAKTHCLRGHPFDKGNTRINSKGWRSCRACRLAHQIEWQRANPEKHRACRIKAGRKWRAANPEKQSAACRFWRFMHSDTMRDTKYKYRYQIGLEAVAAKLAEQNNACAICGRSDTKLVIDHCHSTKIFRGMLCRPCNIMLGGAKDNPDSLIEGVNYLRNSRGASS